jgi:hypothetical protein
MFVGDPGQLPPVKAKSLWSSKSTGYELAAHALYCRFNAVVRLTANQRLNQDPINERLRILQQIFATAAAIKRIWILLVL